MELAHHFEAAAASQISPMRRFMGFNRKKNDTMQRKKLSVTALRAYSMSKCLPECKLPAGDLQTTIDHAKEVFNEVQMLSESKILKARGFNRAYEMGLRVQRLIEKEHKTTQHRIKPMPKHPLLDEKHLKLAPLHKVTPPGTPDN